MNQEEGNTELVLPIICQHCHKEINLGMVFSLLPPEQVEEANPLTPNYVTEQEEA